MTVLQVFYGSVYLGTPVTLPEFKDSVSNGVALNNNVTGGEWAIRGTATAEATFTAAATLTLTDNGRYRLSRQSASTGDVTGINMDIEETTSSHGMTTAGTAGTAIEDLAAGPHQVRITVAPGSYTQTIVRFRLIRLDGEATA